MSTILHALSVALDFILSVALLGIGQVAVLLPRRDLPPVIPDKPGFAMVEEMGLGWNLGNTLEAFNQGATGPAGLESETCWGNPRTSQAMLDLVKAAGFSTVRIPVTWSNHFIDDAYTIDPAWMDRVQEVVDYAYGISLYVILNIPHDEPYGLMPDPAWETAVTAQFSAIWTQVAEHFQDYGERLLFEALNEPRVMGHLLEWAGGTYAQRDVVNRLNAAFVRTVRASGGNNATRWLMLPTHAASVDWVALRQMCLPEGDDRLIVSIHSYYPWEFASAGFPDAKYYTEKEQKALYKMLGRIYDNLISKGIPVYLGEFGAADKANPEDRIRWAVDYINFAKHFGMRCAWWDNGLTVTEEFNGESFALLNRCALEWYYPELVQAMAEANAE